MWVAALGVAAWAIWPSSSWAQVEPAEEEAAPTAPMLPTDDEGPIPEPDVPENPLAGLPPERSAEEPAIRYAKADYPVAIVKRPLTLASDQIEVSLDVPFVANDGHPTLTQVLRGGYGVTVDLEIGLTYAIGLERLDAQPGENGFEVGRAVSLDSAYTLIPGYLAAQLRLAFYIDPDLFGIGLILGLPYKVTIGDRWSIFGGANLVRLKLKELAVDPENPARNLADVALAARGGTPSIGGANLVTGAMFQARENVAVYGTVGIEWPDFDTADDQPFSLFFGGTITPRRSFDLGARLGFLSLADPGASFAVTAYAALRL
jgi:hypothetical protein